jgi:ABC-type phosphonate transport system ATPase subunit
VRSGAALRPLGPYPVLDVIGETGTAKSTLVAVLRTLVDPQEPALRRPPREERDLFIAASTNHVLAYDNLSVMPDWLSDALCRISTGGGYAARMLYTDEMRSYSVAPARLCLTGSKT